MLLGMFLVEMKLPEQIKLYFHANRISLYNFGSVINFDIPSDRVGFLFNLTVFSPAELPAQARPIDYSVIGVAKQGVF